ncbi:MAG TPA: hypothetical protein VLI55_20395 [Bryobacteraceae bacterium]|nr:hypothetical protein [Bryobacteraceae bacterium]
MPAGGDPQRILAFRTATRTGRSPSIRQPLTETALLAAAVDFVGVAAGGLGIHLDAQVVAARGGLE